MSQQPRSLQPLVWPALGACPFCGSELGEEDYSEAGVCRNATLQVFSLSPLISRWYVGCNTCGTTGPTKTNAELAIEAWNERGNRGRQLDETLREALMRVRAWGISGKGFDATDAMAMAKWVDAGCVGPLPEPDGPWIYAALPNRLAEQRGSNDGGTTP